MLTVLLAAQDTGTSWRHRLGDGEAVAGFEAASPLQLARRIGKILGVPALPADTPVRLAALAQRLDDHDNGSRSYSSSRKADPFGVTRFMLVLRDTLKASGWDGRPLKGSPRLADISEVEGTGNPLPPGLWDIVEQVTSVLGDVKKIPFPITIELTRAKRHYPPRIRSLLSAVAAAGAKIVEAGAAAARADERLDLGRVQRALLDPGSPKAVLTGDGSFLVLEADTPVEAAELAASFLGTRNLRETTLVSSQETAVLDGALRRQGLPTLGLPTSSRFRPHLQVLPLRLALAFKPQDPFRAAELLLLPGGPLPSHARRVLLGALHDMPGIGSPAWTAAVDEAVADAQERGVRRGLKVEDAKKLASSLRERIETWFGGKLHDPVAGMPVQDAARLCSQVATWIGGRVKGSLEKEEGGEEGGGDDAQLWAQAASAARVLERLLISRPPQESLTERTLLQLHDVAIGEGAELAAFDPESGRPAVVSSPGGIVSSASEILWWGFVDEEGGGAVPEPWTESERTALRAANVAISPAGELRGAEAADWRHAVLSARERAVLVRWKLSGAESVTPHPFADELESRLAFGWLKECAVPSEDLLQGKRATWVVAKSNLAPQSPMAQRPIWKVPAANLAFARDYSATSLESFLGCPFQWALKYPAHLEPGRGADLPKGPRLAGTFAHAILQDMLCGSDKLSWGTATDWDARKYAEAAFDRRVGLEAASLVKRGSEAERLRLRDLIASAAADLLRLLKKGDWSPAAAEHPVKGTFAGEPAKGFLDLLVEKAGRQGILDMKFGSESYRRTQLRNGQALQLALYASLLAAAGAKPPPSGYFVIAEGKLLTLTPAEFPGSSGIPGPSVPDTLRGAEANFRYWKGVLAQGLLPVPQPDLPWTEEVVKTAGEPPALGNPGVLELPCKFCNFSQVCTPAELQVEADQ